MSLRAAAILSFVLVAAPASAHVGSPDAQVEARVGARHVLAQVRMPRAVPGEATAELRILDLEPGEPADVSFRQVPPQGEARAPAWIPARRSEADEAFFSAPMPLIVFGLFQAEFRVRTSKGEGTLRLPVTARNPEPLRMAPSLAGTLGALTAFLLASGFAIARAVVSDGARDPSRPRTRVERRRGLLAGALAVLGFGAFLAFTLLTWRAQHEAFVARTATPIDADWIVRNGSPRAGKPLDALVTLVARDGTPASGLLEDAGAEVHVLAVSLPEMSHAVHVHGRRTASGAFALAWTPKVVGRHAVFADFATPEAGALTLVREMIVGPGDGREVAEPVAPAGLDLPAIGRASAGPSRDLGGGLSLRWLEAAQAGWRQGELVRLAVELAQAAPEAALPDPSRVELTVLRHDAQVVRRLLPALADAGDGTLTLRFAYAFPQPGGYRLILHFEDGRTLRGASLDVDVSPSTGGAW